MAGMLIPKHALLVSLSRLSLLHEPQIVANLLGGP